MWIKLKRSTVWQKVLGLFGRCFNEQFLCIHFYLFTRFKFLNKWQAATCSFHFPYNAFGSEALLLPNAVQKSQFRIHLVNGNGVLQHTVHYSSIRKHYAVLLLEWVWLTLRHPHAHTLEASPSRLKQTCECWTLVFCLANRHHRSNGARRCF